MSIQDKKLQILNQALKIVPFDGWSNQMMENDTEKAGFDSNTCFLLFKNGVSDLVDFYANQLDDRMVDLTSKQNIKSITQKVKFALFERIKLLSKNKTTAKKTSNFLLLPQNYFLSSNLVWRTSDRIWKDIVNDKSIDFNYYTKRTLLCSIYTASIIYYLGDDDITLKNTEDFLDRRLKDIANLGKTIGKLKKSSSS